MNMRNSSTMDIQAGPFGCVDLPLANSGERVVSMSIGPILETPKDGRPTTALPILPRPCGNVLAVTGSRLFPTCRWGGVVGFPTSRINTNEQEIKRGW